MVCLVTGSSRGLGKAIALSFGKKDYRVAVHYKDRRGEAENVAAHIRESMVLRADVRDSREVELLIGEVIKKWGGLDIMVNNAGIAKESLLINMSEKDFDAVMDTNLKGALNFTRAVIPDMIRQRSGHIINISSIVGLKGSAGLSAYSASKAALIGLTVSAAAELRTYNIMVNAVLPGYMLTDMGISSRDKAGEQALKESLLKKFSRPEDVADFIYFLSQASAISGQVFNLDSRII